MEDCLLRDKANPSTDPRETSRSVSEMKEWVCSKLDRPDGTIVRDCTRLYTGGTLFRVCYTNNLDGSTCLCSRELCNGAGVAPVGCAAGAVALALAALVMALVL